MSELKFYEPSPSLKPVIDRVAVGEDPELERQLVTKSKQPHILKSTPIDAAERFSSPEAIAHRKQVKKRDYYWLLGPGNDLGGIIWFGPKQFPLGLELPEQPIDTFAIRLYENYLGKGLSVPFFEQALSIEYARRQKSGEPMSLWGVTDTDNAAALKIYTRVGFRTVHAADDRTYLVMLASTIEDIASRHQLTQVGEFA